MRDTVKLVRTVSRRETLSLAAPVLSVFARFSFARIVAVGLLFGLRLVFLVRCHQIDWAVPPACSCLS